MKISPKTGPIILYGFFLSTNILAQTAEWKTKEIDNGKITVSYRISDRIDGSGDKVPLIEDSSVTIASLDIDDLISLLKDVSRHREFTDDHISEKTSTISDSEWVVYYYSKNPWPVANSDCVARMTFSENKLEKRAIFRLIAAPAEFRKGDVNRMTHYNVTYTLRELNDGTVEITMTGKASPPMKVPLWLIKSAFPGAPANALRKMVKLAKEEGKRK